MGEETFLYAANVPIPGLPTVSSAQLRITSLSELAGGQAPGKLAMPSCSPEIPFSQANYRTSGGCFYNLQRGPPDGPGGSQFLW